MGSELLTVDQRKEIINQQLTQFAGERFQHQLAADRAEQRLIELPEVDIDRQEFEATLDRARRNVATLESAILVNQEALAGLSG